MKRSTVQAHQKGTLHNACLVEFKTLRVFEQCIIIIIIIIIILIIIIIIIIMLCRVVHDV